MFQSLKYLNDALRLVSLDKTQGELVRMSCHGFSVKQVLSTSRICIIDRKSVRRSGTHRLRHGL